MSTPAMLLIDLIYTGLSMVKVTVHIADYVRTKPVINIFGIFRNNEININRNFQSVILYVVLTLLPNNYKRYKFLRAEATYIRANYSQIIC
jgi:hypothetical protein